MNEALESWGYISALITFLFGGVISIKISNFFGVKQQNGFFLYLWHTIFCLIYLWYANTYGADALTYYRKVSAGEFGFRPGTPSVLLLNYPFVYLLKFSLLGTFLVNNIAGSIGLIALRGALDLATFDKSKALKSLSWIIVLLPSVSFWSSAMGKDSLSFMAVSLALWASLRIERRYLLMAFAIFIIFLVRPHIAGMMIIALSLSVVINSKTALSKRLLIGGVSLLVGLALIPFAMDYAGLEDASNAESVVEYIEGRQEANMYGGGGVDIAAMSLPMQLFSYMFRPMVFEAHSITAMFAALDNTILLFLFIFGGWALIKSKNKVLLGDRVFMWGYVCLSWVILAMTSANMGIAVRQKWMLAPILVFLLLSATRNIDNTLKIIE